MFISQSALSNDRVTSPWGIGMNQKSALRRARLINASSRETIGLLIAMTIALISVSVLVTIVITSFVGYIGYATLVPLVAWICYLVSRPFRRKHMRRMQRTLFTTPEDYSYRVLFQIRPLTCTDDELRKLQPLQAVIDGYFRSSASDDEAINQGDLSRMLDVNKKAVAIHAKCVAIIEFSRSQHSTRQPLTLRMQPAR